MRALAHGEFRVDNHATDAEWGMNGARADDVRNWLARFDRRGHALAIGGRNPLCGAYRN